MYHSSLKIWLNNTRRVPKKFTINPWHILYPFTFRRFLARNDPTFMQRFFAKVLPKNYFLYF